MKRPEGQVYLNNAATSYPKAPGLAQAVSLALEEIPRHPGRSESAAVDELIRLRREIARTINAGNPSEVVLCRNATEALNIALHGLGLEGGTVVTSALEHNSVLRPLYLLEKKNSFRLEIISCDGEGRIQENAFQEKVDRLAPRLVVLNHASNVTGAVNDAEKLLGFAKERGCLTLLDASQTLGLLDIDAGRLKADLIAFTGHKYLLGPPGTGGLYVRTGINLEPMFVGGTGVRSDLRSMPPEMPGKLEPGTPNLPLAAGLLHSLRWLRDNPLAETAMGDLTLSLESGLADRGIRVIKVQKPRTPIISCLFPGWDIEDVGYVLDKSYGIICRTGLHCAPLIHEHLGTSPGGTVRFSLSRFTTREEVSFCLKAAGSLLDEAH